MTDVGEGTSPCPEYCLHVRNDTLSRALSSVANEAGWIRRNGLTSDHTHLVQDLVSSTTQSQAACGRRILVVEPNAVSCRRAVNALAAGEVSGVILADRPLTLVEALNNLVQGRAYVPVIVFELARRVPAIASRQITIVSAILAGQSNAEIGRGLYVSIPTVKRDVAKLLATFGAPNRLALAAIAGELGFTPQRVTG